MLRCHTACYLPCSHIVDILTANERHDMARTRESVKAELIQHPEYARINGLTDTPSAIEYNVSLFYAYKMAFGEGATVEEWQTYTYRDRAKREHYDSLVDLINIHARNEIRVESVPR